MLVLNIVRDIEIYERTNELSDEIFVNGEQRTIEYKCEFDANIGTKIFICFFRALRVDFSNCIFLY